MDQFSVLNGFAGLLHLDAVGKQPQLVMADLVIVEVGSGDVHGFYISFMHNAG